MVGGRGGDEGGGDEGGRFSVRTRGSGGGYVGVPGFNFRGFSASTPAFCNKCLQSLLGCIPTPKFPGAGCIPLIASGSCSNLVMCALKLIDCEIGQVILNQHLHTTYRYPHKAQNQINLGIF